MKTLDRTFWCLGCGPSLGHVDLGFLANQRVIAVNRAHERLTAWPFEGHVWFSDYRFWQAHWAWLERTGMTLHTLDDPAGRSYPSTVKVWRNTGLTGLDREAPGIRTGNNGGHAALNLAYHLGARLIFLLGYDMRLSLRGKGHFHEEHPWGELRERTLREKMRPYFQPIAAELRAAGVIVYNVTEGSALDFFPRITLREALDVV